MEGLGVSCPEFRSWSLARNEYTVLVREQHLTLSNEGAVSRSPIDSGFMPAALLLPFELVTRYGARLTVASLRLKVDYKHSVQGFGPSEDAIPHTSALSAPHQAPRHPAKPVALRMRETFSCGLLN